MRPEFIISIAEPWIGESAVNEWRKAMSSTHEPTWGNSSLTILPHWPYGLNFHLGPTTRPSFLCPPRPKVFTWMLLPSRSYSLGLWSKVSTCDGPPYMNRKMTLLAFGANWEARGASGLTVGWAAPAARALRPKKPTLSS